MNKSLFLSMASVALFLSAPAKADSILRQWQGANIFDVQVLNGYALIPPDMGGAAGGGYVGQFINGVSAFWTNTGALQAATSDSAFWLNAGISPGIVGTGLSDPRILFDPGSNRWFASEISIGNGVSANQVLLAVSNDSNPLDGFKGVQFNSAASQFADFPTLGVNGAAVTLGTNNFDSSGNGSGVSVYSIPKADLTSGSPTLANLTRFDNLSYGAPGWTPEGVTGATSTSTVLGVDYGGGAVYLSTIAGAGGSSATLSAPISIATSGSGLPDLGRQPGLPAAYGIDPGDDRIGSGPVQVGNNIVFTRSVAGSGANGDAVQWGVIDASTGTLIKEGLIQAANLDYLYPSIAANSSGGFVIAMNGSGPSQNISDFWVSCTVGGGCGAPQEAFAGPVGDYYLTFGTGANRWGDYSWTAADPNNPNDFWLFQEYPLQGGIETSAWATVVTEIGVGSVPEPSTSAMLLAGLAGLAFAGFRSSRTS